MATVVLLRNLDAWLSVLVCLGQGVRDKVGPWRMALAAWRPD